MHAVRAGHLQLADGCSLDFDECLWCTQASASGWLVNSGLPLESLEEGLAEFRAWQSELVRFRTGLDQSLRQAAAGEAKILDSEAMKARILERLSATVDHT